MTAFSVPAGQLAQLFATLSEIAPLTPPPAPKGRYVLAKASKAVAAAHTAHADALKAFLDGAVTQDAEGKPIYTESAVAGQVSFTLQPEHQQAYVDIQTEPVVLDGVRMLTHAELGDCPISIQQELLLVAVGLLEDVEPI